MGRQRKLPSGMWKRGNVYWARFRHNGHEVRERLAGDYRTACDLLIEMKSRVARGEFGLTDNDYPWDKIKGEFLRWAKQAVRNPGDYAADLGMFEQYSPVRSIRQIDHDYVVGFRQWRLDQDITPRTVNKQVGTLNNMLNRAVEWGRVGENPIAGIKPLAHDELTKDRRALTLNEVQAVFEESPAYLLPVWRMFMTTGIRRCELVAMQFDDVDFARQAVTVQAGTAKSHKSREIPLDDEVLAIVEALRDDAPHREPVAGKTLPGRLSKSHVFVTGANTPWKNAGNLLRAFYVICKRAGIEDAKTHGSVDIHSLRVTFTTMALENGAAPKAIQAILGHSTLALTMGVYAKATERSKREAIGALPFAKTSAPDHIIPMQNAHALRTVEKNGSQTVDTKGLA